MQKRTNDRTTTERFSVLFREVEKSDAYLREGAKVEIAERIHVTMKQKDISKAELARSLGKSRAYVTKILQGDTNFTIDSLLRIALALDCQLDLRFSRRRKAASSSKTQTRRAARDRGQGNGSPG